MTKEELEYACSLLPEGSYWGDNITAQMALHIAQAARATPVDQEPFGLLETCKRLEESNAKLAVQLQMTRKMHSDLLKQVLRDTTPADQEPASQEKFEWARKVYDVSESVPGELQRFWDCAVKSAGVKND